MSTSEVHEDVQPSTGVGISFEGADVAITYKMGSTILTGKVCSQAMVIASPVWKRFIFPPWQTLEPDISHQVNETMLDANDSETVGILTPISNPDKQIDFTDDDSEALLIILNIIHIQFKAIPLSISSVCLLQLAKLCDQYQCTASLLPWLQNWIQAAETEKCNFIAKEQWLFVYWAFGKEVEFTTLSTQLVKEAGINSVGEYVTADRGVLPEPTPPGIIESILARRQTTIENLLANAIRQANKFATRTKSIALSDSMCTHQNNQCEAMMYGSLLFGLQKIGVWPEISFSEVHISVEDFANQILDIEILVLPHVFINNNSGIIHHTTCRAGLTCITMVVEALQNMDCPVLDSHKVHMTNIRKCL